MSVRLCMLCDELYDDADADAVARHEHPEPQSGPERDRWLAERRDAEAGEPIGAAAMVRELDELREAYAAACTARDEAIEEVRALEGKLAALREVLDALEISIKSARGMAKRARDLL